PSEAMWEYCCRAGTRTAYFTGNDPESLEGYANVPDASARKQFPAFGGVQFDDGYVFTSPVGKFKANAWGLYDMIGNVQQWCSDRYGEYDPTDKEDPEGTKPGDYRVLRGGSWIDDPPNCRAAVRRSFHPASRNILAGFRVACCPPKTP